MCITLLQIWDPWLIIAQIVALQSLFYLSLGAWNVLLVGAFSPGISLAYMLDGQAMDIRNTIGWLCMLANIMNAPITALCMLWIVQRAKKCLDFSVTCYILHFLICLGYAGFPRSLGWWVANAAALVIVSLLGEWLCLRREMQDIPTGEDGFMAMYCLVWHACNLHECVLYVCVAAVALLALLI